MINSYACSIPFCSSNEIYAMILFHDTLNMNFVYYSFHRMSQDTSGKRFKVVLDCLDQIPSKSQKNNNVSSSSGSVFDDESSSDKENDMREESSLNSSNDRSHEVSSTGEENVSILVESDGDSKNKPGISKKKKTTRKGVIWLKIETFRDHDEAHNFLVKSGYTLDCKKEPSDGQKEYYRCKAVPKRSGICPAKRMLFQPNTSTECQIFAAKCDHDHSSIPQDAKKRIKLSKEMEIEIGALYFAHMKTSQIIDYLTSQQNERNILYEISAERRIKIHECYFFFMEH